MLLFVKREVYRCDCLQFLVHFYFSSTFYANFNFYFSSQYILLGLTSCNSSNIVYYTAILCHKLVLLVLVRLIVIKKFNRAIKIFNRSAARDYTKEQSERIMITRVNVQLKKQTSVLYSRPDTTVTVCL